MPKANSRILYTTASSSEAIELRPPNRLCCPIQSATCRSSRTWQWKGGRGQGLRFKARWVSVCVAKRCAKMRFRVRVQGLGPRRASSPQALSCPLALSLGLTSTNCRTCCVRLVMKSLVNPSAVGGSACSRSSRCCASNTHTHTHTT
jgi:hypothetical protein